MSDDCETCKRSRQGQCVFCGKPKQNIPPGQSNRMCQDCWATKTEEGKAWVHDYYSREAAYEEMMRPENHPDYLDESAESQ